LLSIIWWSSEKRPYYGFVRYLEVVIEDQRRGSEIHSR